MDVTPIGSGLSALSGSDWIVPACILALSIVVLIILGIKIKHDFKVPILISVGVLFAGAAFSVAGITAEQKIGSKKDEVKAYVSSLGFEFKSGSIAVSPGTDSAFTVAKADNDYPCTSYAPEAMNEKIFIVCDSGMGVGKGTIEDLSAQINGAQKRLASKTDGSVESPVSGTVTPAQDSVQK